MEEETKDYPIISEVVTEEAKPKKKKDLTPVKRDSAHHAIRRTYFKPGNETSKLTAGVSRPGSLVTRIIKATNDGQLLVKFLKEILTDRDPKGRPVEPPYSVAWKMKAVEVLAKYGFAPPPTELNAEVRGVIGYLDILNIAAGQKEDDNDTEEG